MVKLLLFIITVCAALPLAYWAAGRGGDRSGFWYTAAGALVAAAVLLIQPFYPAYLTILFLTALSFAAAVAAGKFRERSRRERKMPDAGLPQKGAAPDAPQISGINRREQLKSLQDLEPSRKGKERG